MEIRAVPLSPERHKSFYHREAEKKKVLTCCSKHMADDTYMWSKNSDVAVEGG